MALKIITSISQSVLALLFAIAIATLSVALWQMAMSSAAHAKPGSFVPNDDPAIREFYRSLKQPDTMGLGMGGGISCCGEGDAYYADEIRVREGKVYAVITDERPDPPNRMHEDIGTEYEVPPRKVVGQEQHLKGNPTGHVIVFLGVAAWDQFGHRRRDVLCYVLNGGV